MVDDSHSDSTKRLLLVSRDSVELPISIDAARRSNVIDRLFKDILANDDSDEIKIPIPTIESYLLKKVVSFLEHHAEEFKDSSDDWMKRLAYDQIEPFDRTLMEMEEQDLFELMVASDFLETKELINLCGKTIASSLKNKTCEEIRNRFHCSNDYTQEEEEDMRRSAEFVNNCDI